MFNERLACCWELLLCAASQIRHIPLPKTREITTRVDPLLLPLKKGELQKGLLASVNNAHGLVLWLLRADEQGQNDVAMKTLQKMRQQHPNNPKVLAAYCFELDIEIQGNHRQRSRYKSWTAEQKQDFHQTLKRVYELAPTLWVPYAIEGYRQFYLSGSTSPVTQNRGIRLLEKALS